MTAREYPEPRIVPRSEHQLSRSRVHDNALKVLNRLNRSGFRGYLVGGSVRDHLLGRTPKDYDIATDARPNQIRKLFRNSRIIGRRFRLAHIYFREGIIEVATFRRDPDPEAQRGAPGELLITDDNVFGTPAEDAFRRDFTVNALFYNIADFSVVDFVGGIDDLEAGVMRIIGDPDLRFREDPVRMTRACEMAARLGFTIDDATQEGIIRHAGEIHKAAPARLAEEIGQVFRCGAASRAVQWMHELGLAETLFPELQAIFAAKKEGLGDFARAHLDLLSTIRKRNPDSVFIVGTVYSPQYGLDIQREALLDEANWIIRRNVEEVGGRLADIRERFRGHERELVHRLIEPNLAGATAIAELFGEALGRSV